VSTSIITFCILHNKCFLCSAALLFMDVVSSGGLVIDKFTCTVEPEPKQKEDEEGEEECDDYCVKSM